MGTHPIFESDFDCLTDRSRTRKYVACFTRQVPAHFACSEYQHRWYSQHHVRHDRHSWYWSSLLQPDLQKRPTSTFLSAPVNWTMTRSVAWRRSCSIPANTKSPTGSRTDKRTGRTAPLASLSPTVSTPSSVRIWSVSRRSVPTVAAPSVSPRRSRQYDELFTVHDQEVNCVSLCTQ